MCTAQLYVIFYLRGDETDDLELQRVFFGEMLALPYSWEAAGRSALAFSFYMRGDRDAARREFDALTGSGLASMRRDEHWLVTMGSLSTTAVLLGDRARAAEIYGLLTPYAELLFVHDLLRSNGGTVASALGSLAALLERYDEGEVHFERTRQGDGDRRPHRGDGSAGLRAAVADAQWCGRPRSRRRADQRGSPGNAGLRYPPQLAAHGDPKSSG
jgi:hypothetical protein